MGEVGELMRTRTFFMVAAQSWLNWVGQPGRRAGVVTPRGFVVEGGGEGGGALTLTLTLTPTLTLTLTLTLALALALALTLTQP